MERLLGFNGIQVVIFIYATIVCDVCCNRNYSGNQLYHHLFAVYNTDIRPVKNTSTVTNVTYRLLIRNLQELDTQEQDVTVNTFLKVTWTDELLTWDPDVFEGIQEFYVPAKSIWRPDILLIDSRNGLDLRNLAPESIVIIEPNGFITWYTPATFTFACAIRDKYFPFDSQVCDMVFTSWANSIITIDIYPEISLDAKTHRYLGNGLWDVVGVYVKRNELPYLCCPHPYAAVTYRLIIQRKYAFYIYFMVLPCFFLSILSLLVFKLPPDCGEKMTFPITMMLALVFFQQIIAQQMAPSSEESPVIATYFLSMIAMVSVSVVTTALVIHANATPYPVPRWVKHVFLDTIPRMLCMSDDIKGNTTGSLADTDIKHVDEHDRAQKGRADMGLGEKPPGSEVLEFHFRELCKMNVMKRGVDAKKADNLDRLQWQRVSYVLDQFLFYIFGIFNIICTITFTCKILLGSVEEYESILRELEGDWYAL